MASATSSTLPHPKANHPSIAETSETTTGMAVEAESLIAAIVAMGVINRVGGIVEDIDIKRPSHTTNFTLENSALLQNDCISHLRWLGTSVVSTDTKHPPLEALLTPDPGGNKWWEKRRWTHSLGTASLVRTLTLD